MAMKHKLNNDNKRHAKVGEKKFKRPKVYRRNYRQPRNAESGRNSVLQELTYQFTFKHQIPTFQTCTEVISNRLIRFYLYIYYFVNTYINIYMLAYKIVPQYPEMEHNESLFIWG